MTRVSKKIGTPFEKCHPTAAIIVVNALDPQVNTIKAFLEAVREMPYLLVINKVDSVERVALTELPEMGLEVSCKTGRGIWTLKEYIADKFPKRSRIVVLGVFNSGKTSLINTLTQSKYEVGDMPGTTLVFTETLYEGRTYIDSVGQLIDVNKPLMVSIDFSDCHTREEKIKKVFAEESLGVTLSYESCKDVLYELITTMKYHISSGNKVIVTGAGASALVALEMAGQGRETGVPILAFTNNMADCQPVSFSKGVGEDERGLSTYMAQAVNKNDIAIGISASGGTGFVYDFLALAKRKQALTVAITENADTPLGHNADYILKSNAKPEGPSSSKIQTAHLVIGHTLMTVLADERGVTAEQSIGYMLSEKILNKKMGIK